MIKISINNYDFEHFSDLSLSLNYTGFVSTFSFNAPFDPSIDFHKDIFRPLGYQSVKIFYNNELLLTGVIVSHVMNDEAKPTNSAFSGYSKCGILQDVSIPTDQYPLQSSGRSLKDIVSRLIQPFGISASYVQAPEADLVYEDTVASTGQSIGEYVHSLCEQRNLRLSHDANGNLVISKPLERGIFTNFTDRYKALKSSISASGQGIFSKYTAIRQASIENDVLAQSDSTFNVQYRPIVKVQSDGEQGDIEAMAKSMRAASGRSLALSLEIDRWTNYDNKIYKPGEVIGYQNKELSLYQLNNWFIESVTLNQQGTQQGTQEMASLTLVPDWVIFDKTPINPFI